MTTFARVIAAVIISVVTMLYMLPFSVALARERTNTGAIFVTNLLLGWTGIGWVIALVWACAHDSSHG